MCPLDSGLSDCPSDLSCMDLLSGTRLSPLFGSCAPWLSREHSHRHNPRRKWGSRNIPHWPLAEDMQDVSLEVREKWAFTSRQHRRAQLGYQFSNSPARVDFSLFLMQTNHKCWKFYRFKLFYGAVYSLQASDCIHSLSFSSGGPSFSLSWWYLVIQLDIQCPVSVINTWKNPRNLFFLY